MESEVFKVHPLDPALTRKRLERITIWVSAGVALLAAAVAGARFGLSVGLGGALGILNMKWISSSLRAILEAASAEGDRPPRSAWKFVLRYVVIAAVVWAAMSTGLFSLPGILLGLCAFVGAAVLEAIYSLIVSYRHADV